MKTVPVENSVGMALAHDLTRIVPEQFKGSYFKKGHIVREEDIPILLSMGKENLYVLDLGEGMVHEDEAAMRIATRAAGKGITLSALSEGKIELRAAQNGLLKVNAPLVNELNDQEEVVFSTLHTNQMVNEGQTVAATRVIPLVVSEQTVAAAEAACDKPLVDILPLQPFKVGLVTTGSEIYKGLIKDAFGPVLKRKFEELGSSVVRQIFAPDDEDKIVEAIRELLRGGVDMIALTGGMSVDPDDRTPASIRKAGADIVTYGAPALPGAMFLLAYIGSTPVVGLPGCVMYHERSIFDLVVPRILAGEKPTRAEIKALGHGGLCRNCKPCHFPNCGFGKTY